MYVLFTVYIPLTDSKRGIVCFLQWIYKSQMVKKHCIYFLDMAASSTPLLSTSALLPTASAPTVLSVNDIIKTYDNWLHYGMFVHEPLKESLRNILHNVSGDTSYKGLPINPRDLYTELDQNYRHKLTNLLQIHILSKDQFELILPTNAPETHSDKFDVTLLAVIIRNCTTLKAPVKGWKDKHPAASDQSKAANVIRARELRNYFHHIEPKDLDDTQTFDLKWQEGDDIITGLGYTYDSKELKESSLDPTNVLVLQSVVQFLKIKTSKDMESCTDDIKKNAEDIQENKDNSIDQINKLQKDLTDVLQQLDALKRQKDILNKHVTSLQNGMQVPGMWNKCVLVNVGFGSILVVLREANG